VIAQEKLTDYLLVDRPWDDKAKFLRRGGFTQDNPQALREAIRDLADRQEAVEDGRSEYGVFLRVDGQLHGVNGRELPVTIIWMHRLHDDTVYFVTLKPRKRGG
jgi:hypothetical protein